MWTRSRASARPSPSTGAGRAATCASTVGTITEIYDYLRLLYARIGIPHCPNCGREISAQTVQQIVDTLLEYPEGSRLLLLAPLIMDRKGEHKGIFEDIRKAGFVRAWTARCTRWRARRSWIATRITPSKPSWIA